MGLVFRFEVELLWKFYLKLKREYKNRYYCCGFKKVEVDTNVKKQMIESLKNGVRIMSIEARYLYSANKDNEKNNVSIARGYDTLGFWASKSKKEKVPDKLYKVKMPYSLGLEKMYELQSD